MKALSLLALVFLTGFTTFDLDVEIPDGSPLDTVKIPEDSVPTRGGGNRGETATEGRSSQDTPSGTSTDSEPGSTVVTDAPDPNDHPPITPPQDLTGIKAPSTIDYQNHLRWYPKGKMVDWKDPMTPSLPPGFRRGTQTGGRAHPNPNPRPKPKKKKIWDLSNYPPKVPNPLYEYAVTRFLMVMLHKAQVSENELTAFLIEMGYPGYYGASACQNTTQIREMAKTVLKEVGPMVKTPPRKPRDELAQKIYMDLLKCYPYDPGFGLWTLAQMPKDTLPVLLHIVKKERHPFLLRNAVFLLRCFNNQEVVFPLRKLLTTTKDKVLQIRCLLALSRWKDEPTAEWCAKQLHKRGYFRNLCVWVLGKMEIPKHARAILVQASRSEKDGEYLLSAVPAIGRLGRFARGDVRKKIEAFLQGVIKNITKIKSPRPYLAGRMMTPRYPDPPNVRRRIIKEQAQIALARMGHDGMKQWMDGLGFQSAVLGFSSSINRWNIRFFNDTLKLIRKEPVPPGLKEIPKEKPKPEPAPQKKEPPQPEHKKPKEKPIEVTEKEPREPPQKKPIDIAVEELRESIWMYGQVNGVFRAENKIRVVAKTETDAESIRTLLGKEWKGFPLSIGVAR